MICALCRHGSTQAGFTSVTLERGQSVVIFRDVPAEVCDNCEEPYVDDTIARRLLERAEAEVAHGAEVAVVRFAA